MLHKLVTECDARVCVSSRLGLFLSIALTLCFGMFPFLCCVCIHLFSILRLDRAEECVWGSVLP